MDHVPHSMEMQMRMVGHMSNNPEHQHFSVSNERMGLVDQMSSNPGINTLMVPINTVGHGGSNGDSIGSSTNVMPNQLTRDDAVVLNNMSGPNTSLPVKRKAEMGPVVSISNSLPNKHPAHMGANANLHGFLMPSALQRRPGPAQPNSGFPGLQAQSPLNKKIVLNESMPNKPAQRGRPPKRQTSQIESASKSRPESSEAVRSKMRENLASALSLASQKQNNVSNAGKDQSDATINQQLPVNTQAVQSNSTLNASGTASGSQEVSKELAVVGAANDSQVFSAELPPNESSIDGGHSFQEFQYSSIFPDMDVQFSDNFFAKDDLLQGNGLSWAFDFDMQREGEEAQNADKGNRPHLTPENLAFKIEAELFKLFGGVNKKYKEKGRSLLFNLKDRNNPELRERVMSGELPPERLCSMSAEELASKELSEWRMSKAEELAQMVVLPDTDGDMRRLVKKTHKGEYQVEFERDDGIVDEISGGTTMLTRLQPKKETESNVASKGSLKDDENASVQKNVSGNQELSGSLVIPTDGTDLMQGMMVEELKDTESLPPIVSLDEFMESLNSEPPFENLSADGLQKTEMHEERTNAVNKSKASDRASDSPNDFPPKKTDFVKKQEVDMTSKSSVSPKQNSRSTIASVAENIWEGALQLSLSSSVTVRGQFQSGEKTSAKDWPTSLEIKGRVRLDAFEKFLQELPMSRTRAVMVLHVGLKDGSSEKQSHEFSEAVESYSADERLGYAEPAPGVELYLCPPTSRMAEMLNKHLPKHRNPEMNISTENDGLIGVVVWRRAHMSSSNNISPPNSSSSAQHKHSYKKQHYSSAPNRMMQISSSNVNLNTTTTPSRPPPIFNNLSHPKPSQPQPQVEEEEDDDDDIPPGFGPGAAKKDDDDLPEFNFSSHLNHPQPVSRISSQNLSHGATPVDQVRELIKKYGQSGPGTGTGDSLNSSDRSLGIEPWNDDDDDIPEWRPEVGMGHRPALVQLRQTNQLVASPWPPSGVARLPPAGRWVQQQSPLSGAQWRPY